MLRRLFAFFAFVFVLAMTSRASAAIVHDGLKFSVDTGAARICWVTPLDLRNASDCEGLTPDAVPVPPDDRARVIAMGLVRLDEPGDTTNEIALVMVMHVALPITAEPNEDSAKEYADGASKAVAKELRKGARMREAKNARLVKNGALPYPLIRVVLDADGIPDGAEDQLLEHQIHIAGIDDDGMYSVAFLSKRRDAKAVEAYADALGPSFKMTKPATSAKELDKKIEAIATVVVLLGTLLIGGVISIIVVVSRRNKPAPYAYPYPYHAQASSYPPPAWHPASAQGYAHPQQPMIPPPPAMPRREWWDEMQ